MKKEHEHKSSCVKFLKRKIMLVKIGVYHVLFFEMACHWKLQNIEDYDTKPFVKNIFKMLWGDA